MQRVSMSVIMFRHFFILLIRESSDPLFERAYSAKSGDMPHFLKLFLFLYCDFFF